MWEAANQPILIKDSLNSNLQGMDLLKHGESAYPAAAWVEQQYMEDGHRVSNGLAIVTKELIKVGLPPNMNFSRQVSFNGSNKINGTLNSIMEENVGKKATEEEIKKVLMNGLTEQWTRRQSF